MGPAVGMDAAVPKDLQVVERCCLLCVEVHVDVVGLEGGPRMDYAQAFQRDRILNGLQGFAHAWG